MPKAEDSSGQSGLDDFDRIVAFFNKHHVDFLIIGGYAVIFHGDMRSTKDLDLWIRRTVQNAERTVAALEEAGFVPPDDALQHLKDGKGITFGEAPVRVEDILTEIPGVDFDSAWKRKETSQFGPNEAHFIGIDDLITNKEKVARGQDLVDAEKLRLVREKTKRHKSSAS
jgi:hypothetical protein